DEANRETVIRSRCLTVEETQAIVGDRDHIERILEAASDWYPIACTADLAIILEQCREPQCASYRLKTASEQSLLDIFYFEERNSAFSAFAEDVGRYEKMRGGEVSVLTGELIEKHLAF
ncbi:MAG: hypothetical protein CVU59_06955, partial [Deltaproteobacteria bacterium HGW-Deltaproteobacteria-17]